MYEVVLNDPQNNVLYTHERPGQIVVLERGTVSVQRASRELRRYQKNLQQELIYLRRNDASSEKDQHLLCAGDWREEQQFMINTKCELIMLQHRKSATLN